MTGVPATVGDLTGICGQNAETVVDPFQPLRNGGTALIEQVEAVEKRLVPPVQRTDPFVEDFVVHPVEPKTAQDRSGRWRQLNDSDRPDQACLFAACLAAVSSVAGRVVLQPVRSGR